jgi:hypothetical protein
MTTGAVQDPALQVLDLRLSDLRQLFNSMDPAPFRERDLDLEAEDYIVSWSREMPAGSRLALDVHLGHDPATADEAKLIGEAVHEHFSRCAQASRRRLRQLFRTGRVSLVIGVAFLAAAIALAQLVRQLIASEGTAWLMSESLIIGGWVALWRPMEIFLYDWWPIRADIKLFDRLGAMDVRLRSAREAG